MKRGGGGWARGGNDDGRCIDRSGDGSQMTRSSQSSTNLLGVNLVAKLVHSLELLVNLLFETSNLHIDGV